MIETDDGVVMKFAYLAGWLRDHRIKPISKRWQKSRTGSGLSSMETPMICKPRSRYLLCNFHEMRDLFPARVTPRSPEVEENYFALAGRDRAAGRCRSVREISATGAVR